LATALIVVGVAYALGDTAWYVTHTPPHAILSEVPRGATSAAGSLEHLLAANLFGVMHTGGAVAVEPTVTRDARFTLEGTFAAARAGASFAIVSAEHAPSTLYRVGDDVPGAGRLVAVDADRVVVELGGARRAIAFETDRPTAGIVSADGSAGGDSADDALTPSDSVETASSETASDAAVQPALVSDPTALAETYVRTIEANPQQAVSEFGLETVRTGEAAGYRVAQSTPYFDRAGLKLGDVILSVNGTPVGDPSLDRLELANLIAVGSTGVTVNRDGRVMILTTADDPLEARRQARQQTAAR